MMTTAPAATITETPGIARRALPFLPAFIIGGTMLVLTGMFAYATNGGFGFPLDDAWIHLQFAKNLRTYGVFSYFQNHMVTSGSTSPLYTALLAAGMFVTNNEFLLSYFWGVTFLLLSAFLLSRVIMRLTGNSLLAAGGALLLLLDRHLLWIALSGMETTLFLCGLLAAWDSYLARRTRLFGVFAGLLIWIRPEGILFLLALLLDGVYHARGVALVPAKKKQERPSLAWIKDGIVTATVFFGLYALFNLWLSGTVFPNTLAAKVKYYGLAEKHFHEEAWKFLSGGHETVYIWFAALGAVSILADLVRRRPNRALAALLWPLALYIAFWRMLPVVYQEGRYLMPVLPFVTVLGLLGIKTAAERLAAVRTLPAGGQKGTIAVAAGVLLFAVQFGYAAWEGRTNYADYCKYISDRQVRGGKWMSAHLPPNAIIGTHDVGAIAYYSDRRIADMVGLVSPEMIENIGSLDRLRSFLIRKKVTHLALLRNWFEIDNEPLLYESDPAHPEILQVFEFHAGRTHFVPQDVTRMRDAGVSAFTAGNLQEAGALFQQAYAADQQSSRTSYWVGRTLLAMGKLDDAEKVNRNALHLFPAFTEARLLDAEIAERRNDPAEAARRLEAGMQSGRDSSVLGARLVELLRLHHLDTAKAASLEARLRQLSTAAP